MKRDLQHTVLALMKLAMAVPTIWPGGAFFVGDERSGDLLRCGVAIGCLEGGAAVRLVGGECTSGR